MAIPTDHQTASQANGDANSNRDYAGHPTPGDALDLHSIAIAPLAEAKLRDLRRIGREVRDFEALAFEIMRTQATLAIIPPHDDPEAMRGLRRTERRLLLEALSLGTEGAEQLRLAATLTRCVADVGDNLVTMLAAALDNDCMRSGLAWGGAGADTLDA